MVFVIRFSERARNDFEYVLGNPALAKRLKAVRAAIGKLQNNPRHPGLNTHKYNTLRGAKGEEVFEAYVENSTPGAYRIFWHYGPSKEVITILAITPHP